jgi:tetratricopeptide (TPR) repeat protein
MPRYSSADIAHLAVTNHRVPRRPAADPPAETDFPTLVDFFRGRRPDDPDADRDLGLALVHADPRPGPRRAALAETSLPLLEAAALRHPSDVPAAEGWGWALACLGRPADALDAYRRALGKAPDREQTLILAAQAAEGAGRFDDALGFRLRLTALNPYLGEYHADAAKLLARKQDWPAALREAEAAVRLTPAEREPRLLLIAALLRQGERTRAAAELEALVRLTPADEAALRLWFARQR